MSRQSVLMNSKIATNNSRGLKLLGLRVVDIISNIFPQSREANGGNGGKLMRSEFFGFWNQVSSDGGMDASNFLESLLDQFRAMVESKNPPIHNVSLDSMINTIAFMVLYSQFHLDNRAIKQFIKFWQETNHEAVRDNHSINNIVRLMSVRVEADVDAMLGSLIIGASTLLTHRELTPLFAKQPTYDESDIQANEMGFVYNYLCQSIRSWGSDCQLSILSTILNKTLTLSQQMKVNPALAQTTMMALLHMARQVLNLDSIANVSFLKRSIATVQPYFLWPQPHGSIARNLMEAFQSELLSPGWNRRELLLHEAAVVDYGGYQMEREPGYTHSKPIFYLYDSEDASALSMLNVIDPVPFTSVNAVRPQPSQANPLPAGIQALCLLHAISADVECTNADVDVMRSLTPVQTAEFFRRLQELDQVIFRSQGKARVDRAQELRRLKDDMIAAGTAAGIGPILTPIPRTPESAQPFCPPLPPVEHVRVPLLMRSKNNEHEKAGPTFPAAYIYDKLQDIVAGYALSADKTGDKNSQVQCVREIRFVIVGNDAFTQHIACSYFAMTKLCPDFFKSVRVKFYLAPCTKNSLAGYIARHDAWYHRHVFTPLRSPCFLVPWLRDDENELKTGNDGPAPIFPTAYLRDCLTQYARESAFTLDTVIFQIEGYYDARGEGAPDEVVPFIQRAEIGLAAAVEEYRLRTRKPLGLRPEEALKDKAFSFQPLDLGVRFSRLDLSGLKQPELIDEPLPYTSILLANVPRKTDSCFPPDPTAGCLEMYAQAHKADRSKYKKNTLIVDPKQHVAEVVVTSSNQQKFRILADGNIYGPYASIRITVGTDLNGKVAKFPVQTFFPIDP